MMAGQNSSVRAMETDEPEAKRIKLIDPDNQREVSKTNRPQMVVDEDMRIRCMSYLVHGHIILVQVYQKTPTLYTNITAMEAVTGVFFSLHQYMRQNANGTGGSLAAKIGENITLFGVSKTTCSLVTELKKVAALYGLEYAKNLPWLGTFSPMLSLVRGFTANTQEVRVGVSTLTVGMVGGSVSAIQVQRYGVMPEHHVMGVGMGYSPQMKSNIPQSLGAAVALINLVRANGAYADKWKRVVMRHISHLPDAEQIVEALSNSRTAVASAPLIRIILDILLLTTARTVNRAFIPSSMLLLAYGPPTAENFDLSNCQALDRERVEKLCFSGTKAATIFNKAMAKGLTYNCSTPMGGSQIIFHGVWRTHVEDLNLLEAITGIHFVNRKELQAEFTKKSELESVQVHPIQLKKFSKLATACQTDLLLKNKQQLHNACVFSGNRYLLFSESLLEIMQKNQKDERLMNHEAGMIQRLLACKNLIIEKIRKEPRVSAGRMKWLEYAGDEWIQTDYVYPGDGVRFFLGED